VAVPRFKHSLCQPLQRIAFSPVILRTVFPGMVIVAEPNP
jgi:hypothetical protein